MPRGRIKGSKELTIDQLYAANKGTLDDAGYSYNMFANNMKTIMKENNVRTPGAYRIFKHKTDFTSREEIGAENLIQGIKSQGDFKDFRKEVIGWHNKIDAKDFTYDEKRKGYTYTNDDGDIFLFTLPSNGSKGSQVWKWEKI